MTRTVPCIAVTAHSVCGRMHKFLTTFWISTRLSVDLDWDCERTHSAGYPWAEIIPLAIRDSPRLL